MLFLSLVMLRVNQLRARMLLLRLCSIRLKYLAFQSLQSLPQRLHLTRELQAKTQLQELRNASEASEQRRAVAHVPRRVLWKYLGSRLHVSGVLPHPRIQECILQSQPKPIVILARAILAWHLQRLGVSAMITHEPASFSGKGLESLDFNPKP